MNLLFRTIVQWFRSRRAPKLDIHDVGRTTFHVLPTDIDILGHMNNGVYFSIMDLGRLDLMMRAGAWARLSALGFYPVSAGETITFRKSLQLWQKFTLESRIVGYDDRAVFVEQRFVVDGEIFASAVIRARFLKKTGGTVPLEELADTLGVNLSEATLPAWLASWSADSVLPPTRGAAPSEWS